MDNVCLVHHLEAFQNLVSYCFYCFLGNRVIILVDPLQEITFSLLHNYICGKVFFENAVNFNDIWVFGKFLEDIKFSLDIVG